MGFHADLHVHSKYSRATSGDCDLEHLALWACRKGIAVVATGDFTHPAWLGELNEKLVPAEPGLLRLDPDSERLVAAHLPGPCAGTVRFMLQVEIATIYKKDGATRKIHHLVYVPSLEAAAALRQRLVRIGNLDSDGRPILGLDSHDLLEIVLECDPDAFLVPAHIWTPWFAVLGSKSGFDSIDDCYGDLASHIFAAETGLSSDPLMNWRLSALDRYRLVSSSDAHSPAKLGREACRFDTAVDYFAIKRALESGEGYAGTVEFFPEEGKYHLDGHRACGVRLSPQETRAAGGRCPTCGKPVTVGVMHRVEALADRETGVRPAGAPGFRSLVPLAEVLAEIVGTGPQSKAVSHAYDLLLARLGPELFVLEQAPLEEVARLASPLMAEALDRLRRGAVRCDAGYDGEYGTVRLFEEHELERRRGPLLFELPAIPATPTPRAALTLSRPQKAPEPLPDPPPPPAPAAAEDAPQGPPSLAGLDPDQRRAALQGPGPMLIIAGPGTGKTRTITQRIAHLVLDQGVSPAQLLAVTFTRRAAAEMHERLQALLGERAAQATVSTFHGLGLSVLRENAAALSLPADLKVLDESARAALLGRRIKVRPAKARRLLDEISRRKRSLAPPTPGDDLHEAYVAHERLLAQSDAVDCDDLVVMAVKLLETQPPIAQGYQDRYRWVFIDEYQDIDPLQYRLIRLLVPSSGNLCAVGDPDQAIYGFRGSDVAFFMRFQEDFPGAPVFHLRRNYRSSRAIVEGALQVVAPSTLVPDRTLEARHPGAPRITCCTAATDRAEAELVVHTIEQLVGGHSFFSLDSGRSQAHGDLAFSDIAVLFRSTQQVEPLVEALARSGMPFSRRTEARLGDHPLVIELLARIPQSQSAVRERLALAVAALREERPAAAAELEELEQALAPIALRAGLDLERFADEVATSVQVDAFDPRGERVALLTLHAAKGLEFKVVFIVGCEDGLLPLSFGSARSAEVEEERRLFFVGMTRARERLFLLRAEKRLWHGKQRAAAPSPFLSDISQTLIEQHTPAKRKRGKVKQLNLW